MCEYQQMPRNIITKKNVLKIFFYDFNRIKPDLTHLVLDC